MTQVSNLAEPPTTTSPYSVLQVFMLCFYLTPLDFWQQETHQNKVPLPLMHLCTKGNNCAISKSRNIWQKETKELRFLSCLKNIARFFFLLFNKTNPNHPKIRANKRIKRKQDVKKDIRLCTTPTFATFRNKLTTKGTNHCTCNSCNRHKRGKKT